MVDGPSAQRHPGIGIDTGGTFTDFVWLEAGRLRVHKQLSTPPDPSQAIIEGLARVGGAPQERLVHGSTVATNALLERRGARTALVTTAGFRDVLAIGRQNRPDLYALVPQKPPPLVPRKWRFEVDERVSAKGEVIRRLEPAALQALVAALKAEQIESVAVCLLFSFQRPEHEVSIRRVLLEQFADEASDALSITLSSELLPEYREYERTSTTVINAYVSPVMGRYLRRLADLVHPRTMAVMQSNGGLISINTAASQAARTVLSGPAGGVVGAFHVARQAGFDQVITLDMGGTSTDVALCPGELPKTSEGDVNGMPMRLPIIDIHTVGAGGGSLAMVDAGGALQVGPQSAGADPGPAAYGMPGKVSERALLEDGLYVTTTDANLVLGRLDAGHFLGGAMPLDEAAAMHALDALARRIGAASAQAAAWDVVRVANATMERAVRRTSVERGYDPRDFTLVAFGGAGPLHACDLAGQLQIPRVLVPATPGVLSALGMLVAEPTRDYSRSVLRRLEPNGDLSWLETSFAPLIERGIEEMRSQGFDKSQLQVRLSLDMRYEGQSHELTVPCQRGEWRRISGDFHAAHEKRYGYQRREAAVEVVNLRLAVVAPSAPLSLQWDMTADSHTDADLSSGTKPVWFGGQVMETALYRRGALRPGQTFQGPAIVFQYDTTTVIPPDWRAQVDASGNLLLTG